MAKVRNSQLESANARLKLWPRRKPYFTRLAPGIALGYRRNDGAGTWSVRVADGSGGDWLKKIGLADDYEPADGSAVLSVWQAMDAARKLARNQPDTQVIDVTKPVTVEDAIVAYRADLKKRGGKDYNATRADKHLTETMRSKPVALLTKKELADFQAGLLAKGLKPATVNRTCTCLRAALELAAKEDQRIKNVRAFKLGLAKLPGAERARNVILDDATVLRFVRKAYTHNHRLGVFTDTLAVTGSRASQAARLLVEDFKDGHSPRLMMPRSGKGGGRDRMERKQERIAVPISTSLAAQLREEAKGRAPTDRLLRRPSGEPWGDDPSNDYRRDVREVVTAIGLNPDDVTMYALRHSSIVRMLLKNVPIRVVASLHDTSVVKIEQNYSKHIADYSDEIARAALLQSVPLAVAA